jgi:hypothetical protein
MSYRNNILGDKIMKHLLTKVLFLILTTCFLSMGVKATGPNGDDDVKRAQKLLHTASQRLVDTWHLVLDNIELKKNMYKIAAVPGAVGVYTLGMAYPQVYSGFMSLCALYLLWNFKVE